MTSINPYYAALDLGSNSFHLIIVKVTDSGIQEVDKVKHMVRLGEGLTKDGIISHDAFERGLEALTQMGQLISNIPREHVRAVGTNTLRVAENGAEFLAKGEALLGHNIEIISGQEEARLIYLGITEHNHFKDHNLVIDIGGGSTEMIAGQNSQPELLRSMKIGCANMARRFFPKGRISKGAIKKAMNHVGQTVEPHILAYQNYPRQRVILSSGTAKSVLRVIQNERPEANHVTAKGLNRLLDTLQMIGHADKISAALGIDPARAYGFTGGVCILAALFKHLDIDAAVVSQEALREGVLLELMGRTDGYGDERERTVTALQQRFNIDTAHAARVTILARHLSRSLGTDAPLRFDPLLEYAGELHEIGLAVSLGKHQNHGAYLIRHLDMPGFSHLMQQIMAILVKGQRKKLPGKHLDKLPKAQRKFTWQFCLCLRLAALIYRSRIDLDPANYPTFSVDEHKNYTLTFPAGYLDAHPLTMADLQEESELWAESGKLTLNITEGQPGGTDEALAEQR